MKISFVIPVYNNADTLKALALQLQEVSAKNKWIAELIFVDDCSRDYSIEVLKELLTENKRNEITLKSSLDTKGNIIAFHSRVNCGQSTTVLTGLRYATGDYCVVLDADLQDRPEFFPFLITGFTPEIDVVFSGRKGNYEKKSKLVSAKGFKYLLHLLSKKRLPVDACMFFAIKRQSIAALLPYSGSKPYLLAVIAKAQLRCISIPYQRAANPFNKSNYTFIKRWKTGIKGVLNFFTLSEKEADLTNIEKILI